MPVALIQVQQFGPLSTATVETVGNQPFFELCSGGVVAAAQPSLFSLALSFPEQALEPPQVFSPFRRWYCLALLQIRYGMRPLMLSCRPYAANMHNCVSMTKRKTVYEVWGRQCGDGWNDLVQPLEDELLRLGGTIRQIKEKFGCLCSHYALPSKVPEIERLAFARRVRQAEEESVRTCETCGRPGELACDDGFYLTAYGCLPRSHAPAKKRPLMKAVSCFIARCGIATDPDPASA